MARQGFGTSRVRSSKAYLTEDEAASGDGSGATTGETKTLGGGQQSQQKSQTQGSPRQSSDS